MSKPVKHPRIPENAPLSPAEQVIIAKCHDTFKEKLTSISENTIVRFVRGYKDDPNHEAKTIEMLGHMIEWRTEMKVNEIANTHYEKEELFRSIWTSGIHGRDKLGHAVYIDKIGAVDGSKLYKHFTIPEVINFHIKQMEYIQNLKDSMSKEAGRRLYKQIVILDFKGLGMSHLSSKFTEPLKKFIKIDQDMYPETLYKMIIVNAGFILKTAWAIASPMLDAITKSNILFGEAELKNYIEVDQIPKYLGGTCQCEKCLMTPFMAGPEAAARPSITALPAVIAAEHARPSIVAAASPAHAVPEAGAHLPAIISPTAAAHHEEHATHGHGHGAAHTHVHPPVDHVHDHKFMEAHKRAHSKDAPPFTVDQLEKEATGDAAIEAAMAAVAVSSEAESEKKEEEEKAAQ